jgi:hypothetical protein
MLPANPIFPPNLVGQYSFNDRLSGYLLFDQELVLPETHHEWANATPAEYSFNDGLQTLTSENSTIRFSFGGLTVLGTESAWIVDIMRTDGLGGISSYFDITRDSNDAAAYLDNFASVRPNPNPSAGNPGTWTTQKTPEPATLLLITIGTTTMAWRQRRHRPVS